MSQSDATQGLSPVRIDIPLEIRLYVIQLLQQTWPAPSIYVPAQTGLLECQGPRRGPVAGPLRHHGD